MDFFPVRITSKNRRMCTAEEKDGWNVTLKPKTFTREKDISQDGSVG